MEGEKHISWIKWEKKIVEKEKGGLGVKDVALLMALIACKMKMRKIIKDDGSHGFK